MARAGGWSPRAMRNSEASFTVREKPGAASRRATSLRSCTSYSFMFEPQPAALTTTASRLCPAKASMVRPASCSAVFASPACEASAPQQTRTAGTTTSQPLRVRARAAVEALIDVRLKVRVVERHQPERRLLDLPHPPARAIAFVVQAAKGRALR